MGLPRIPQVRINPFLLGLETYELKAKIGVKMRNESGREKR